MQDELGTDEAKERKKREIERDMRALAMANISSIATMRNKRRGVKEFKEEAP